jgi:rSAM/selenodomain-associated transferase 1
LIIMVKEPVAGRVKTRLARGAGTAVATAFLRTNLALTTLRLARDRRWQTLLCVAPDAACNSRMFPRSIERLAQGRGDLGQRMARATSVLNGAGPAVIIGADIPAIRSDDIAAAFRALQGADAVFGPAGDGGYWLVGLAHRQRGRPLFCNVRWSSPYALADTIANLGPRRFALISQKDDVDEPADLSRLAKLAQRLIV